MKDLLIHMKDFAGEFFSNINLYLRIYKLFHRCKLLLDKYKNAEQKYFEWKASKYNS